MAKNRLRRSGISSNPECTCSLKWDTNPPRHADHDGSCALWHLEDFMNGLVDWDPIGQSLMTMYPTQGADELDAWDGDVPIPATDLQDIIDATVSGYRSDVVRTPGAWTYQSCRHNMTEVHLPDEHGTLVHCSGSSDCRNRLNRPEWAVYLCNSWTPRSLALFVPWADYGTPTISWRAARMAIEDFYMRAKAGMTVEVGCMGGHGRTGTFLACVAMLADPNLSAAGALAWVRANYCSKAVEDESQEYFLRWFADPSLPPVAPVRKPIVTVVTAGGGGCNWKKHGKPCQYKMGHTGGHYYGAKNVTAARALPQGTLKSGAKKLCPMCQGKGGVECGTCGNWRVVEIDYVPPTLCKEAIPPGSCKFYAGHAGACMPVTAPVSA